MKIKKIGIVGIVCLAVLLTGCRVGNTKIVWKNQSLGSHKYIFQINGQSCDVELAKLYLCNYRNLYGRAYGIDLMEYDYGTDSLEQYVKDVTIQELTRVCCMNMLAEQQGMSLTDEETEEAAQAAEEYYQSLSDAELDYMGVKESDVTKAYEEYALAQKLYHSLTDGIDEEVSDDEARVIRVQQIYVTDLQTAEEIQKLLEEGADFASLASTYSRAQEIETTIARDEYPQEVENIAFNLDNDAVSDMIETDDGYYFIKCLNKFEEQLTEDNKDNIRQKRRMEQFDVAYQEFIDAADFQMNESLWIDIHLEDVQEFTTDSFFEIYTKYFE